eukprot:5455071-Karenia_brevis.AAC.1
MTGRTLDKAIVDLGKWTQNTLYASDMKGCIALSRVRAAHDLLLTCLQLCFPVVRTRGLQSC